MVAKIKLLLTIITISVFSVRAEAFWFKVPKKKDTIHTIGTPSKDKLDPNNINLLVWNIYKGKNNSWEEDFNYLHETADILVLQEALLNNKIKSTLEKIEDKSFYLATSFIYKKNKVRTGVMTGSTVKPYKSYAKKSKNVEWIGLTPKMMLFTEYPIESKKEKLLVVNIHAINFVPWYILARQIRQAGRKIKKHNGPIVFAGDFNVWNKKKTDFMKRYLTGLGMEEVIFPNGEERMKFKLTNKVLDYIWIKDLDYQDASVWSELEGADHKAMSVTLRLK